ncbi:MAG TPA: MBL fold metallo-hydrolase, partial [Acidobacteria bacterium]|nr:MBL fold metallo-hydrolase [Acidobacteriota bacterium]
MRVEIVVLASGSSGNAVLVRSGETSILVDAGISRLAIERRVAAAGHSAGEIAALLVTHEHSDHVAGIPVLLKRHPMPVWATAGTWSRLDVRSPGGGELSTGRAV